MSEHQQIAEPFTTSWAQFKTLFYVLCWRIKFILFYNKTNEVRVGPARDSCYVIHLVTLCFIVMAIFCEIHKNAISTLKIIATELFTFLKESSYWYILDCYKIVSTVVQKLSGNGRRSKKVFD